MNLTSNQHEYWTFKREVKGPGKVTLAEWVEASMGKVQSAQEKP